MTVPGRGLALEALIFEPEGLARGAVVLLHGFGDSAHSLTVPASQFAEHGYVAVSVSMRGFGRSEGHDDCGLRQPDDVVDVVGWVRGRVVGDDAPVGLFGISQGGQVALLAAARGAHVNAVAAWAAVTDVECWRETTAHPEVAAYVRDVCADGNFEDRSPVAVADGLVVPVLLVHGDADVRVPTEQTILLSRTLTALGRSCQVELLPGLGHRRGRIGNEKAFALTAAFFNEHLHVQSSRLS